VAGARTQHAAVTRPRHVPAAPGVRDALAGGHLPEQELVVAAVAEEARRVGRPADVRHEAAVALARAHELPLLRRRAPAHAPRRSAQATYGDSIRTNRESGARPPHAAVSRRPSNRSHNIVARTEGLHVRRESVGVVYRSRVIIASPRAKPYSSDSQSNESHWYVHEVSCRLPRIRRCRRSCRVWPRRGTCRVG
jgi:hypothetical protein